MKLIVLKIIIIVIELSNIANFSNLRQSSKADGNYIDGKTSNLIDESLFNNKDNQMKERLNSINFDYLLLNLNIIEQKIDQFKSKLKGNLIIKNHQRNKQNHNTNLFLQFSF